MEEENKKWKDISHGLTDITFFVAVLPSGEHPDWLPRIQTSTVKYNKKKQKLAMRRNCSTNQEPRKIENCDAR